MNEGYAQPSSSFDSHPSSGDYNSNVGYWTQAQPYSEDSPAPDDSRRQKTKVITLIVLICLVAVIGVPWYLKYHNASEFKDLSWREFGPGSGSFSILMPGEPQSKHQQMMQKAGRDFISSYIDMYSWETPGGASFVVAVTTNPPGVSSMSTEMILDQVVDGISNDVDILSRKNITFNGYQGLEVQVKSHSAADYPGVMRIYWAPPSAYVIGVALPETAEATAVKAKFLDSFKLLNSH